MSNFYFGSSSNSSGRGSPNSSDDDDDTSLPYPAPLPRADFLKPDFDPSVYLSSLGHRHQTLEDLRAELRGRSQLLNQELLDLVNAHYQDFLSLGSSLKGGDERVEELRIGLLGFQREVDEVKRRVEGREREVDELLEERVRVRKEIALGRKLLDYDARLARLEAKLMVDSAGRQPSGADAAQDGASAVSDSSEEEEDEDAQDDDGEGAGAASAVAKLRRRVNDHLLLEHLAVSIGAEHPFIEAQKARSMRVRQTLLLDMSAALKHANAPATATASEKLKVMALYRDMDASKEAVEVLKSTRKQ